MTPAFGEAIRVWLRIGLLSFGGPAAQIALMHREVVETRRWISEERFLSALSFCMLLPGPEAMQLATYFGWRLHGIRGGLAAGLLFVAPGAAVIAVLAAIYATIGAVPLVAALFLGVKAAVLIIVLEALLRVARKALRRPAHWAVAGGAFVAIFFFAVPFPVLILAVGAGGYILARPGTGAGPARPPARMVPTIATWAALWWAPVAALMAFGAPDILTELGVFFSKLAVVTFGGAYAVLAYMAQDVVTVHGWLDAGAMLDGLGLAETTPGPLILVTEFVGFQAGYGAGGLGLAVAGAAITLWVTFAPCFLWIFAFAPWIDWISGQARLKGALDAITAAVVGVILNLTVWFALHVLFATVDPVRAGPLVLWTPQVSSFDPAAFAIAALSAVLLLGRHWGVVSVLLTAMAAGLIAQSFT